MACSMEILNFLEKCEQEQRIKSAPPSILPQRFHTCRLCQKGRLLFPDVYCLECEDKGKKYDELDKAEDDLEKGLINEHQYLLICEKLKQ